MTDAGFACSSCETADVPSYRLKAGGYDLPVSYEIFVLAQAEKRPMNHLWCFRLRERLPGW
jgi:hypothetical protein